MNATMEEERGIVRTGFEGSAVADALVSTEAGAMSAVVREESELKAAIVVAKRFPRDEAAAVVKITKSCSRPAFAECASYRFPRGGQQIEGPSVDLAREMARCWGNIRYGLRIVTEDEDRVHIKGFAMDLETNNTVEAEDKFSKLIQRKGKGWVKPDERDLRELVNRRGAICVRNAILQLLPPDVTDDAQVKAAETMRKAAAGELKQNREDAVRRLAVAFDGLGVTTDMLAAYLKHELKVITDEELAALRKIWKSISDGQSNRGDYFDVGQQQATNQAGQLAERFGKNGGKPAEHPDPDVPHTEPEPPPVGEPQTEGKPCASGFIESKWEVFARTCTDKLREHGWARKEAEGALFKWKQKTPDDEGSRQILWQAVCANGLLADGSIRPT